MTAETICPCQGFVHPACIHNPPGLESFAYRAGDYDSFRHALLLARDDELALKHWRPTASGDLALQMVEWWAYVADVLTFYNERIANESYLRSATQPEHVRGLIRLLGYRPRPGIGSSAVLAALSNSLKPLVLPSGFQVQSKPGPGKQPQIFELGQETVVNPIDARPAEATPDPALLADGSVLLQGAVTTLKPLELLLLLPHGWTGDGHALVTVKEAVQEKDPRGKTNTRVSFTAVPGLAPDVRAADYRLLRSTQSAGVWTYPTGTTAVIAASDEADRNGSVHVASIVRQIAVNDPVLFESTKPMELVRAVSIEELVWFANGDGSPTTAPDPDDEPAIPIPHTVLGIPGNELLTWDSVRATVRLSFAWQDVGKLIASPAESVVLDPAPQTLAATDAAFPIGTHSVLIADQKEDGFAATATVVTGATRSMSLTGLPAEPPSLMPPLQALFNLLAVTRGQTVANELLGSGDAARQYQEFVLKKSPLTYLPSTDSSADYASTLRVWVDGSEWQEVASFYGQPRDARVFVTREDDEDKTHVTFGDGVNGARLPSGRNNVVATYRYGSGKDAPAAGSLKVILKPQPGLQKLLNPVAAGGGSDPDAPDQVRRLAPRSILTFGRAISADDYEVLAAQTPGVARARSYFQWDARLQRPLLTLYVGDDAAAVTAARTALARSIDPNRPVNVLQALPTPIALSLTLQVEPDRLAEDVVAAVGTALIDADAGLLGSGVVRIGARVYDSHVYQACIAVPGVRAVHDLEFRVDGTLSTAAWHDPELGHFFRLDEAGLSLSVEQDSNV